MRGINDESGEFLSPSRSEQRREALEVRALAERLVAQSPARLEQLPLPEGLLEEIVRVKRITSNIAHKRELQYLAKLMRREDDETLEAIRAVLEHDKLEARREVAHLHRAEAWRDRLLAEGDVALGEFIDAHPDADRQALRQLVRSAVQEQARGKPPRAARELFRSLRVLTAGDDAGA